VGNETRRLLLQVTRRLRVCRAARQFYVLVLALAGAYAGLLMVSRLLGVIPHRFEPMTLLAVVAGALAAALASYRRPNRTEAARRVDERHGTEELFLTAVLIDKSAGRYAPLVVGGAEQAAGGCRAREVVPWSWAAGARNVAIALAVLLAGVLFLPQLDPFGQGKERERRAEQRRQLQEARKATALRAAQLKPIGDAGLSDEVQKALEELKQSFGGMKPRQKEANLQRLAAREGNLAKLWRTASENRLRNIPPLANQLQRFGERRSPKADAWQQELKQGSTEGVRRELSELKQLAEKIGRTQDEAERLALSQEMKERLEQLKDFAANQCASAPLDAAVQRALEQLAMAGLEGLSSDALAGLQESLDLTELELEALAKSLRDLQALEDALKALQWAKRLGELDLLDGEACESCQCMADYAELYKELMAGRCKNCGGVLGANGTCPGCGFGGIGGTGIGQGGIATEDPDVETDFKPEKSRSALSAGKVLLSIKAQGITDPGQAVLQYRQSMQQIRQGLNEAILHEQVPPAYHEAIRKYFDAMEGTDGQAGGG